MSALQTRRGFVASVSGASAASLLGGTPALADEGPPETPTVRIRRDPSICIAPTYVGEELLRAEGFTDIRYVPAQTGITMAQMFARGELDFAFYFAAPAALRLDGGLPILVLAGVHVGCFELFAHEPVRTINDLKGRKVGIDLLTGGKHVYVAMMAAHVGLDPQADIAWVEGTSPNVLALFTERRVDAFLAFPPEPQELRARKVGRVILSTTTDKPWSQYYCCMLCGNRGFVRNHPVATKRVLRAILKAADFCAAEPREAAQRLVDGGFTKRYDYALQTLQEIPYRTWRDYDAEDTMRFYALRLHELGFIKSNPNELLAEGTDWRFLDEVKRELKT